ncbi:uncharacterized protein LOC143429864 [Xylocopa sonorina]|uniref:uncharacterized protein LOC143429864 n=1 Tax=Xylocopa sonorina TaxID=1818115 RepID=UPI00403A8642
MFDKNNDDSSSSEDEISKDALAEAVDHQFLKNSYLSNQTTEKSDISKKIDKYDNLAENKDSTKPISLRHDSENQDRFFSFGVSPSFQSYVAKQLDGIIEKSIRIKKKEVDYNVVDEKESEDNNCGIKLLNSSVDFLSAEEESIEVKPRKRRKSETTIDDEATLLKCKEVALEPERILSKEETKAWTSKRKEPEFKYKRLKSGTLVEKT